jgi:outer membrane protein assembly factor BamB
MIPSQDDALPAEPKLKPKFCIELDGIGPTCSSPAFDGQRLIAASDGGTIWSFSPQESKVDWQTEIGNIKSSPVIAGNHLYAVTEKGVVHAFSLSGAEPVPVANVDLREEVMASPAAVGGSLFVRTRSRLYCLRGPN